MPSWSEAATARVMGTQGSRLLRGLSTWGPAVLWSGAILMMAGDLGSSQHTGWWLSWLREYLPFLQAVPLATLNRWLRSAGHFLAYAGLLGVWVRACWRQWPTRDLCGLGVGLGLTLAVALLDEGWQSFHRSRSGSLNDVLLDMSGALSMALALLWWRIRKLRPGRAGD